MTRPQIAARLHVLRAALELVQEREALDRAPLPQAARGLEREMAKVEAMLRAVDAPRGLVTALAHPETERRLMAAHGELQSVRAELAADAQRAERSARAQWNRAAKLHAIQRATSAAECHADWYARLRDDAAEPLPASTYNPED